MNIASYARIASMSLVLISVATLAVGNVQAEPAPGALGGPAPTGGIYTTPTRISDDGVPEYGRVGRGTWQEAGIANAGEPSIRIVYDETVPGAREYANAMVNDLLSAGRSTGLREPGSRDGLNEVGYTAHYDGVQAQVYSNSPYVGQQLLDFFAQHGWTYFYA
jgi:hypothetical protein